MFVIKKITVILIVFLAVIAIQSCNIMDVLNEKPSGNIHSTDEVFSKANTTLSYLNTVYSYVPFFGMNYFYFTMLGGLTDDGYDADANQPIMANEWYSGSLSPTFNPINHPAATWNSYFYGNWWQGIRKANVFLAHIDDATLNEEHQDNRSRYKAEARLLRAFFYLNLIKEYGGMPIRSKPFPPDFNYKKLTRPSFNKDVQFIVNQCDSAISNHDLPWRITKEDQAFRFTKAVAYAIESEATLFNASPLWNPDNDKSKWEQAAKVSQKALNALLAHGYELYPNYEKYFDRGQDFNDNPSDRETILQAKSGGMMVYTERIVTMPIQGLIDIKAGVGPTQELVDSYDMKSTGEPAILGYKDADHSHPIINQSSGYDPDHPYEGRDPRFYATVWYNQAIYPNIMGQAKYKLQIYGGGGQEINPNDRKYTDTGYYLRKYVDPAVRENEGSSARWKIFQLAEIYLNYAEAANEAYGPTSQVYDAIKTIRKRVNMLPYPPDLTKKQMRRRIHNERRVELSFEEHRFWDQRRWKILGKTGKVTTGMQWTKHSDGTFTHQRFVVAHKHAWKPKFLIFPIPENEMSKLGPNFKQNPGW